MLLPMCALYLQAAASSKGDDTKRKFEQQKKEVVGESKGNIKEAEKTLQSKASLPLMLTALY